MSENQTKNNHFVPIFYLENFLDNNGALYQHDIENPQEDIENPQRHYKYKKDLKKVGSKNNLYTLTSDDKISDNEYFFFRLLMGIESKDDIFFSHALTKFLNDELSNFIIKPFSTDETVSKAPSLNNISRNQEVLYSMYENGFQTGYNEILKTLSIESLRNSMKSDLARDYIQLKMIHKIHGISNTEFLPNKYFDFIHYIMSQYFRTNKMIASIHDTAKNCATKHEALINSIDDSYDLIKTLNNCSKGYISLCMHYFAINCICATVKNYKLILLINESKNVDFIISDQPCMNTYFDLNTPLRKLKESELEIYFPLST